MSTHPTLEDYSALSLRALARLLSEAGGQRVTVGMLKADVVAGAPTNVDGTINLAAYAAWLASRGGERS